MSQAFVDSGVNLSAGGLVLAFEPGSRGVNFMVATDTLLALTATTVGSDTTAATHAYRMQFRSGGPNIYLARTAGNDVLARIDNSTRGSIQVAVLS